MVEWRSRWRQYADWQFNIFWWSLHVEWGRGGSGGTADAMQFAYQPLVGDGSIVARLTSWTMQPNANLSNASVVGCFELSRLL